jgi:phage protein D
VSTGVLVHVGTSPIPDAELAGASSVEVQERAGEPTTYRLRYASDIEGDDFRLVADGRVAPGSTLTVTVADKDGKPVVLVRGPVVGHQARLMHGGAGSYVEVQGSDRCVELDRAVREQAWTQARASDAVTSIFAEAGLVPDVEGTDAAFSEKTHMLAQRDTDLRFVRRLARRYGYLFWITSAVAGDTAHFRKPKLDGAPAATLSLSSLPPTMRALEVTWDVERPTSTLARGVDLANKATLDGGAPESPLTALGKKGLAALAPGRREALVVAPADTATDLRARSDAALIEASWFVRGRATVLLTDVGVPLRAHTIVQVDGAGMTHSGRWFVSAVRHIIDATGHVMEVELVRNGWGA